MDFFLYHQLWASALSSLFCYHRLIILDVSFVSLVPESFWRVYKFCTPFCFVFSLTQCNCTHVWVQCDILIRVNIMQRSDQSNWHIRHLKRQSFLCVGNAKNCLYQLFLGIINGCQLELLETLEVIIPSRGLPKPPNHALVPTVLSHTFKRVTFPLWTSESRVQCCLFVLGFIRHSSAFPFHPCCKNGSASFFSQMNFMYI